MARTPVASDIEGNAIRFRYADGPDAVVPADIPYARELDAQLPSALEGATAGLSIEEAARNAISGNAPAAPPPAAVYGEGLTVATDAAPSPRPAGPVTSAPLPTQPSEVVAGAIQTVRAGAPTTGGGRFSSAADRALAAELDARRYGLSTQPAATGAAPTQYAVNPNEGQPEAPKPPPVRSHTIPGQWFPGARQYQSTEVPQEAKDLIQGAQDDASMANQLDMVEKGKVFEDQRAQEKASEVALQYEREQMAKRDAERRADAQRRLAELDAEAQQIASEEINPNGYWDKQGTGSKILLGLAVFLSGVGNAKQYGGTGTNPVLDMINNRIKDDIDAQKANLANRKAGNKTRETLYSRLLDRYGDEKAADAAAFAAYQGEVSRGMERLAKQAENPARAAEIMRAKSALDAARGQNILDWDSRKVSETEQYQRPQTIVTGGGAAAMKPDRRGAKEYGKARAQFGIDTLDPLLNEVEATARRYKPGETVPGWSAVDMALYERGGIPAIRARHALSGRGDEAVKNFQLKIATTNNILRTESGAAIGEQETVNKSSEWFGDGDVDSVRNGIARAQRVKGERVKGMQQTYGPAAVETYHNNVPAVDNTPTYEGPIERPGQ